MYTPEIISGDVVSYVQDQPPLVPMATGELLDINSVAEEDRDRVLDGYIMTARVLGSVAAAEMYKKAKPDSTLTARWFESQALKYPW